MNRITHTLSHSFEDFPAELRGKFIRRAAMYFHSLGFEPSFTAKGFDIEVPASWDDARVGRFLEQALVFVLSKG